MQSAASLRPSKGIEHKAHGGTKSMLVNSTKAFRGRNVVATAKYGQPHNPLQPGVDLSDRLRLGFSDSGRTSSHTARPRFAA